VRPINAIRYIAAHSAGGFSRRDPGRTRVGTADGEVEGCRTLIAVVPAAPGESSAALSQRPLASFLAHLIAIAQHAPQTCARRRVEPSVAIARYHSAAADSPIVAGCGFTRSC
jgi:hypothetical protein